MSNNLPGPGEYSPNANSKSPLYSLGRSQRSNFFSSRNLTPGPGAYSPSPSTSKSQYFPLSKRGDLLINDSPGPGTYNSSNQ